jgi:hypothetical protein
MPRSKVALLFDDLISAQKDRRRGQSMPDDNARYLDVLLQHDSFRLNR